MTRLGLVALLALVTPAALAWGPQGHEAIAIIAQARLNVVARRAVLALLPAGQTMADVATWADAVRAAQGHEGPLVHDAEARQLNRDFPHNAGWHFVNLPLGLRAYAEDGPFSGPDDVVHAIARCVRALESAHPTPHLGRSQALRFLIHLVGDIHQPLHVGTGYYRITDHRVLLVTDPAAARHTPNDAGGNALCYAGSPTHCLGRLHPLWDGDLVRQVARSPDTMRLVAALRRKTADPAWQRAHAVALSDPDGDHHAWAAQWASASVREARAAYAGIRFGQVVLDHGLLRTIAVTLPPEYAADQLDRVAAQLLAAGIHLAHLLDRIDWP